LHNQVLPNKFSMRNYPLIIPVRFTAAQLAEIDSRAAELKIGRSTLIRETVLSAIAAAELPAPQTEAAEQ